MEIYLYTFLFWSITLFLCEIGIIKKNRYVWIVITYSLLIYGQRWRGGVDFYGYLRYYLNNFQVEPAFTLIQNYLSSRNIYFGLFIFGIYLFTTISSVWFLRKFSNSNYLIFFYLISEFHIMSINPLRTYIAICILLFGIYNYYFNKKYYLIIFIIFASLFHYTAIIAGIIFIFFQNFNFIIKRKFIIYILLLILPILPINEIIYYLIKFTKYRSYIGGKFDVELSNLNVIRYYIILIMLFLFDKIIYYKKQIKKKYKIIRNMMILFLICMGAATKFALVHRVAYYFKIFEVIYLFLNFNYLSKKSIKIFIIFIFLINYLFIVYKDTGVLKNVKIVKLRLYNESKQRLYRELEVDKFN